MPTPQLGYFWPVSGGHPDQGLPPGSPGSPDQGLPQPPSIWPPVTLPPLPPGVWPNPPVGVWPPHSPSVPSHPIYLPEGPDHTLPVPPATIWPPLPPGNGIAGKGVILIWVVGVGYRWLVVQGHEVWPPVPPSPQPK
jgi:hypothetical protein